jgi:hypothetical protein
MEGAAKAEDYHDSESRAKNNEEQKQFATAN